MRQTNDVAPMVQGYARQFQAVFGDRVPATSAFGAWLLLALLAPAASGERRAELERVLGGDAQEAFGVARALLERPHPALSCALALWARPDVLNPRYEQWSATLPSAFDTGPVPTQAAADRWAAARTADMIATFPVELEPTTVLVLASALTTQVAWSTPYDVVDSGRLGGPFGALGNGALTGSGASWLASTRAAGLVGVHHNTSDLDTSGAGIGVLSVIAAPSVPAGAVHEAALEVLAAIDAYDRATGVAGLGVRWSAVPLGEGHAWTVEEVDGFDDRVTAVLPAWRAAPGPFALDGAPGFAAALGVALSMLTNPQSAEAAQSVFAEYTATGFRAAAVTAMQMLATGIPRMRRVRVAEVRFNRPYVAVAYAIDRAPGSIWSGVPMFAAWVDDKQLIPASAADRGGSS